MSSSPSYQQSDPIERKNQLLQSKLTSLSLQVNQLELDLGGEDAEEIIKRHIKLLHLVRLQVSLSSSSSSSSGYSKLTSPNADQYNERKDASQIMLNKIANLEECSVKDVQRKLGIDGEDDF